MDENDPEKERGRKARRRKLGSWEVGSGPFLNSDDFQGGIKVKSSPYVFPPRFPNADGGSRMFSGGARFEGDEGGTNNFIEYRATP